MSAQTTAPEYMSAKTFAIRLGLLPMTVRHAVNTGRLKPAAWTFTEDADGNITSRYPLFDEQCLSAYTTYLKQRKNHYA